MKDPSMAPVIDIAAAPEPASARLDPRPASNAIRPGHLCLVVHDDLELRLKLAGVVRGAAVAPVSQMHGVPEVAGYRVLKKIAHSAAATVYLARSDDLAQSVALKVQHIDGKANITDEDRQRFSRECAILSSMNHRSIADVIDYGMTAKCLYLAMEYFPCGSMRERLRNPLSEADAVNYARQIAKALQLVHPAGIVHRDLKPSNLMMTADNRIVLIDFGSTRTRLVTHELSSSDPMTGSPYYACPEQIDGKEPDHRGDLYSLGVVLYEMLAGTLPFLGNSVSEIFQGHRLAAVPPLAAALKLGVPRIGGAGALTGPAATPSASIPAIR